LYFQPAFLTIPAALFLLLAGSLFAVRPHPAQATSKATERTLARLAAVARSEDSASFFAAARDVLLQTFATRWGLPADRIDSAELKSRLGAAGEDVERLFALADEAKYSDHGAGGVDFQRWLTVVRGQLARGKA
jgi:predicted membrane metal-binding protein